MQTALHNSKTYSDAGATGATRIPSLCSMWSRSRSLQRSHAAHGSEARGTIAHSWKRCPAAPTRLVRPVSFCDTIRSRQCHQCSHFRRDTPTQDFIVGDTFQDRRQPGHQDAAPVGSPPLTTLLTARSQCHQVTPSMTAHSRTAPFGTPLSQNATSGSSKILGQQHSGPLRKRKRVVQPQTDEQRGKRAFALTARGTISKAMKGLVKQRRDQQAVDYSPHSTELGQRNSSHYCGKYRGGEGCLGRWQVQSCAECNEGARPQQNRYRVAPARQNGAHECSRANQEPARGGVCTIK